MEDLSRYPFRLPYLVYGKGDNVMITFHGFGQDASYYQNYDKCLPGQYTLYSFYLPYHGHYKWQRSDQPVTAEELAHFFASFFSEKGIQSMSIVGYSIGARLAMILAQVFPERTRNLVLIAPDGISKNFWFYLATSNYVSRAIFKMAVKHTGSLIKISGLLSRAGLLDPSLARFANRQIGGKEDGRKVYNTWAALRKLKPSFTILAEFAARKSMQILVVLGDRDKVIPPSVILPKVKNQPGVATAVLQTGHVNLIEETGKYLERTDYFIE